MSLVFVLPGDANGRQVWLESLRDAGWPAAIALSMCTASEGTVAVLSPKETHFAACSHSFRPSMLHSSGLNVSYCKVSVL